MQKIILKILIVFLCVSALLGIIIIVSDNFGRIPSRILGTTVAIFAFSIAGLCCSTIYDEKRYKNFSIFGILSCLLGCLWLILIIWDILSFRLVVIFTSRTSQEIFNGNILWTLILLSCLSAHISLLLNIKNTNPIVDITKKLTILLAAIFTGIWLFGIWFGIGVSFSIDRLFFVIAILATLGTIISPILNKVYKSPDIIQENYFKREKELTHPNENDEV